MREINGHNWNGLQISCPRCNRVTLLQEVLFDQTGILILSWCPDDKIIVKFQVSYDHLVKEFHAQAGRPVKPPLQLPPPTFTPEDWEILHHDFHIKDEEEGSPR